MNVLNDIPVWNLFQSARSVPTWAPIPLVVLGGVYLLFGKRLFRILIAGAGAAVGYHLGLLAAGQLGILGDTARYVAIGASLVLGGISAAVWQIAIFLVGAVAGAMLFKEAAVGFTHDDSYQWFGLGGGFLIGGIASAAMARAMAVGLTAFLGACMLYVGGVALLAKHVPFVARLPDMPLVSLSIVGVLTLAGSVAQMAQPDEEDLARRKLDKAEAKAKAKADAEAAERYQRYLDK